MARRKQLSDMELRKKRKENMIQGCIIADAIIIYFCMLIGNGIVKGDGNAINAIMDVLGGFPLNFYKILPTSPGLLLAGIVISALIDVLMFDSYLKKKDIVQNPNGDAAFEEDFVSFDKEFVIDPAIVEKVTGAKPKTYYDEEHKKIVTSPKIKNNLKDKVYKACWFQTQLYANQVALSLNGSWAQRNSNAIIFGASGAGKSRYFLNPNLLQANSNYVVTDPSGEIMLGYGAFLQKEENYDVKCLNISDMEHSCRFNPLQYIKDQSDIPVIVTTLMENTQKKEGNSGGDGDFWTKTTQALLCAIIGYLYEVEPIERRNFYNVLEMLRMAQEDEDGQDQEATDFDRMFEVLGKKNPNSYAFHQYLTYSMAPRKTALNILISTAVLLSTYIDIPEFNNLTYKDEMELDKFGAAPYKLKDGATLFAEDEERYSARYKSGKLQQGYIDVEDFRKYKELIERDEKGRYVEGAPYKMAVFLCIPTADTTYNWLTAMLYSIVFKLIYRRGETRAKEQVMPNPRLAFPARLLIDECANIGKIPNLQEYLATCRKYAISIVPIFQSFSQIEKVYGEKDANSIYANCDTTLFLGGVDSKTLKIVCERLGKESVKALSTGTSGGARNKSNSTNLQNVGRELMSRIQVEQMSNSECLVFIRALKPFKVKKFNLNGHPNYKYTAEADPDGHSFVNPFFCEYDDFEIESIRIKKVGELGYNEPQEVNSARLRASKQQALNARKEMALSLQRSAAQYGKFDENAPFESEKERREARADHEAYIEALRTVYLEAKAEKDNYSMDVIASTCARYDIDIGIDMGIKKENSRSRSSGTIDRELFDDEELIYNMREISEAEAIAEMKKSMTFGSPIISGITTEFDLATMEQVYASLGDMVKGSSGDSVMMQLRNEVNNASVIERKEREVQEVKEEIKEETKTDEIFIQQQGPLVDIDFGDEFDENSESDGSNLFESDIEGIEDIIEAKKNQEHEHEGEAEFSVNAEDILKDENLIPTEEELHEELSGEMDFSGIKESEEDFGENEGDENTPIFIDSGDDVMGEYFEENQNDSHDVEKDLQVEKSEDSLSDNEINDEEITGDSSEENLETFVKEEKLEEPYDNKPKDVIAEDFVEKTDGEVETIITEETADFIEAKSEDNSSNVVNEESLKLNETSVATPKKNKRFLVATDDEEDNDDILLNIEAFLSSAKKRKDKEN